MKKKYGVFRINDLNIAVHGVHCNVLELGYIADTKELAEKYIENHYLAYPQSQATLIAVDVYQRSK